MIDHQKITQKNFSLSLDNGKNCAIIVFIEEKPMIKSSNRDQFAFRELRLVESSAYIPVNGLVRVD